MSPPPSEFNPYAAPAADPTHAGSPFQPLSGTPARAGAWREGDLLVMSDGAELPDRCLKCNEPAGGFRLSRKLYWHEPAWYLVLFLGLIGLLIYLIVALVIRKKVAVALPLCENHRRRRVRAIVIGWVLGLGGLILMPVAAAGSSSVFADRTLADGVAVGGVFLGGVLFFGGIIYGLTVGRVVGTKKIVDRYVWLSKVDRGFLAALPPALSSGESSEIDLRAISNL